MISKKLLTIIAGLTVLVSGTAGFAVVTGAIYIGPSVPGFNITGNGTTDVGVPVYLGVTLDSTPASSPYYLWFANGKTGTGEYFSVSFSSPGTYKISLQVSMDNNHTKKTEYATEVVNRDPSVSISENKNTIDAGQYISFTSSVSGGTGPYSYSWTSPGSSNADPTMQLYSDIGGVYVTITDAVGYSVNSNILNPTINTDPYELLS